MQEAIALHPLVIENARLKERVQVRNHIKLEQVTNELMDML
jgi:hypothetical protein